MHVQSHHTVASGRGTLAEIEREVARLVEVLFDTMVLVMRVLADGVENVLRCVGRIDGNGQGTLAAFATGGAIIIADLESGGGVDGRGEMSVFGQECFVVVIPAVEGASRHVGGEVGGERSAVADIGGHLRDAGYRIYGGYGRHARAHAASGPIVAFHKEAFAVTGGEGVAISRC